MAYDIALKLDPDREDIDAIVLGLIEFNRRASGRENGWQTFAFHLTDETGKKLGGLSGWTIFDWLYIELFHIPEPLRSQGHGAALMDRAEQFARDRGCIGVWLDTYDWQAAGFYEKRGYECFGKLEDHPIGRSCRFYRKRL